jgi:hypothetical protein
VPSGRQASSFPVTSPSDRSGNHERNVGRLSSGWADVLVAAGGGDGVDVPGWRTLPRHVPHLQLVPGRDRDVGEELRPDVVAVGQRQDAHQRECYGALSAGASRSASNRNPVPGSK